MLDKRLVDAVADVFGLNPEEVTPELSRTTLADWDSVGHLRLILAVEEAFHVRLSTAEIPTLTSVARLQEALHAK